MNISREESLLIPEITQRVFDILSINLRMEGTWIKDGAKFEWASEVNHTNHSKIVYFTITGQGSISDQWLGPGYCLSIK